MFIRLIFSIFIFSVATISLAASDPVLEYQREFSMLAEDDNSVDVRIYADGVVRVHYPFFMRLAGDYRFQLSQSEVNSLLGEMRDLGIDQFDADQAQKLLVSTQLSTWEDADRAGGTASLITDPEITRIRIARLSVNADRGSEHVFSFAGARQNAQLYPQLTVLDDLIAALDILEALTVDSRMQREEVEQ